MNYILLRKYIREILAAQNVSEIESILKRFVCFCPSWEYRVAISGIYTPRLNKMLRDRDDKYRVLEDLDALCWRKNG